MICMVKYCFLSIERSCLYKLSRIAIITEYTRPLARIIINYIYNKYIVIINTINRNEISHSN